MPLAIAVITAYFLGNRFTKNVYEVLIDTNGTPFLPEMPDEAYTISAFEVKSVCYVVTLADWPVGYDTD